MFVSYLFVQVMDIPDLEDQEDISRQVAAAPAVRSTPIVNIAELESADLFRLPVVDKDHQVDLSLLTASLCPADQVWTCLVQLPRPCHMLSATHSDATGPIMLHHT